MICEKCWGDARRIAFDRGIPIVAAYEELLVERESAPCTPEERCGRLHAVYDRDDNNGRCVCGKISGLLPRHP